MIEPFSDEQARVLINLRQHYEVWIEAERSLRALPYDLRRKTVAGNSYLYEIFNRSGNGRSLGAWDDDQARKLEQYRGEKEAAKARRTTSRSVLEETGRLCRTLRVPLLPAEAGQILRECDRRRLLDGALMVVGTNAMAAYALEAGGRFINTPQETQDFDLAWSADEPAHGEVVWDMLKAVDATYTVNMEREFQARNAKAYEVELLVAPSRAATRGQRDKPRSIALPEQEWLLNGRPVDQIIVCRDASPARIVAPDPRWFGLHKLWMAQQSKRNTLKRPKDLRQGLVVLNAVAQHMPHYALDAAFAAEIPTELTEVYDLWRTQRPPPAPSAW